MKKFDQIVHTIFHLAETDIRDELTAKDIPEWDSMNYLLFIAELENEFQMSFEMNEVLEATTLGNLRKIVAARGTKNSV